MFPGPVFYSELRKLSRQRRFYAVRFVFGLLLLYFVVQTYASLRWMFSSPDAVELTVSETAMLGQRLFGTVFWLQSIAVLFLTPALLAGAIAEDRQRRVLDYLLASPLNAAEIVLGKVAARLLYIAVIVASCFPIVSISLLFGGIDPRELALTYAATFSTIFFLAGVSIAVSTFTAKPREAILRAYFWVLCWLGWPVLAMILRHSPAPYNTTFQILAPVLAWFTDSSPTGLIEVSSFAGPAGYLEPALWMIGLQLVYGTLLLLWATLRLRPSERGARLLFRGPIGGRSRGALLLRGRKPCGNQPMVWKECSGAIVMRNLATAIIGGTLLVVSIGALGYFAAILGAPALEEVWDFGYTSQNAGRGWRSARYYLNGWIRGLTAVVYALMLFMLAGGAATSYTIEREKDTWISLLATPLEGTEIVVGKFLGAIWRVRFVLGLLLAAWIFGLVCGAVHPLAFLLIVALTAMDVVFVACLGCYVSLRSTSSARAIALTIGALLVVKGGYLFVCAPFLQYADTAVYLAGATPFIVTFATGTYEDVNYYFRTAHSFDWTAVVCVCLMFHCFAIVALAGLTRNRFEIEADRPDDLRSDFKL